MEVLKEAGSAAAILAAGGLVLLVPLYLSLRRDVVRLRAWREASPNAGEPHTETFEAVPGSRTSRAQQETGELPALARIGLAGGGGLRGRLARLPEPRHPLLIAAGAFLVGMGIFLGTMSLLSQPDDVATETRRGGVVPAEVTVAVLGAAPSPGLAGKVADDVEANGYGLGTVTRARDDAARTAVLYAPGMRREARAVAQDLGVRTVEPLDAQSRRRADGAEVVVIAGQDRAR